MLNIYEEIARRCAAGETCVLATIVRRRGSAPRKDHAKMLILPDGSIRGSVGGGCVEAEVWQAAMLAMKNGECRYLQFDLSSKDAAEGGLMCGGQLEIFVEPILPAPKMIIFGGGHVSKGLVQVCRLLGFHVTVIDDRESFANRDRFPEADELIVGDFDEVCPRLKIHPQTYLLIVTRGHEYDLAITQWAIGTPALYIGLLGSKRKISIIRKQLLESGISKGQFSHLFGPIGLDIGSETPEEIAVAVAAELVMVRKGLGKPRIDWTDLAG